MEFLSLYVKGMDVILSVFRKTQKDTENNDSVKSHVHHHHHLGLFSGVMISVPAASWNSYQKVIRVKMKTYRQTGSRLFLNSVGFIVTLLLYLLS